MSVEGYAGDLSPQEAHDLLQTNADAQLIDVRTAAEWNFVGYPDLSPLGKQTGLVEWLSFPDSQTNPDFVEQVNRLGIAQDAPVLLLCRSGQRSRFAAIALTAAGYQTCYNVSEGFEGDKDAGGHRGTVGGWKLTGLPWRQG